MEEVEVKLRLMTREDHAKAKSLFVTSHVATYDQENYFFDGQNQELSSQWQIMRIRFYNRVQRALLTVKGRASLVDGIGRALEEEEDMDCAFARKCLENPDSILEMQSDLVQRIKNDVGVKSLVSLGGFENIRDEYEWEGFRLEIDETIYDFGTNFEIECETDQPEDLRDRLEKLLTENEIHYQYRTSTKFACFMKKSLDD